jgi:hypothetical protein
MKLFSVIMLSIASIIFADNECNYKCKKDIAKVIKRCFKDKSKNSVIKTCITDDIKNQVKYSTNNILDTYLKIRDTLFKYIATISKDSKDNESKCKNVLKEENSGDNGTKAFIVYLLQEYSTTGYYSICGDHYVHPEKYDGKKTDNKKIKYDIIEDWNIDLRRL